MSSSGTDDICSGGLTKRLISIFQWIVAFGAFWYITRNINWNSVTSDISTISTVIILGILVITVLEFGSRFSMWYALLSSQSEVSIVTTARIDLTIKFINHLIPSKASGHSIAPVILHHYTDSNWSEAVSIAGVNTGLYALLYGFVALAGLAAFALQLTTEWLLIITISTGIYIVVGIAILLTGRHLDIAGKLIGRLEGTFTQLPKIGNKLNEIVLMLPTFGSESAATFREKSGRLNTLGMYVLAWAGTIMIFPGIRVWLLLDALGETFTPVLLLPVMLVMAYSVTVLPLTPGGVGIAEASTTTVFIALGVAPGAAAVIVVVDRVLGVYLPAILGWLPVAMLDLPELFSEEM